MAEELMLPMFQEAAERIETKEEAERVKNTWATPPTKEEMLTARQALMEELLDLDKHPVNQFSLTRPRECFVLLAPTGPLANGNPVKLGPYHSNNLSSWPLADRIELFNAWLKVPHYGLVIRVLTDEIASEEKKRVMPEKTKLKIRKRNAMKRVLKQYGMFADQFIGAEYERKDWHEWTEADEQLWAEEKAKAFTVKKKKKRKAKGRSTDNDALLKA